MEGMGSVLDLAHTCQHLAHLQRIQVQVGLEARTEEVVAYRIQALDFRSSRTEAAASIPASSFSCRTFHGWSDRLGNIHFEGYFAGADGAADC